MLSFDPIVTFNNSFERCLLGLLWRIGNDKISAFLTKIQSHKVKSIHQILFEFLYCYVEHSEYLKGSGIY